jgi:hypothetical protein
MLDGMANDQMENRDIIQEELHHGKYRSIG